MTLTTVLQDNMEGKVDIRAKMQEKLKALKERQAVKTVKQTELSPKMKEFIEKVKAKAKERGAVAPKGTMKASLFREKMLERRNGLKSIIEKKQQLNKKEVSHD